MKCEFCYKNSSKRIISGIPICEDCFSKLMLLRKNDIETFAFFSDSDNLKNSSNNAKQYINSLLEEKHLLEAEKQRVEAEKQTEILAEKEKRSYAKSFNEFYEYDVVTIINENHGTIDKERMKNILSEYTKNGWKLHTIYSNELGKNAIRILGLGVNSTACEDVLIFERRISELDP